MPTLLQDLRLANVGLAAELTRSQALADQLSVQLTEQREAAAAATTAGEVRRACREVHRGRTKDMQRR